MASHYRRKYGVEATLDFELYTLDGTGLKTDATSATGDVNIQRDEAASEELDADAFTDRGQSYSLVLSATEMQAARIIVHIVDQSDPQVWLDKVLIVETYGNASAQHAFDQDSATVNLSSTTETQIDAIETDTNELQGLISASKIAAQVKGIDDIDLSATMKASVNAEADTALTDYDPPTKAEMDTGHGLLATEAKQDTIDGIVDDIKAAVEHATYGLSAIRTRGDAAWITADLSTLETRLSATRAGYLDNLSAGAVALEATLTAIKGGGWTNETLKAISDAVAGLNDITAQAVWEYATRTLTDPNSYKADVSALALEATLTALKGAGWSDENIKEIVDKLEHATYGLSALRTRGDSAWITAAGFSTHAAADIWSVVTRALTDKAGFSLAADQSAVTIGTVTTLTTKTGFSLSDAGIDSIIDEVIEGTLTLRAAVKVLVAALVGKSSGGGTTTHKYRDTTDTYDRITATVDEDGNRTGMTLVTT